MDSIIDYVKWMGDFPIGVKEFCEVDAIVLSSLAYIDFTDGLAGRKSMLLKDYEGDPFDAKVCLTSYIRENRELLEAAIASRRFGDLEIAHYVQIYRPEEPLQFAAVTYRQEDFAFVAYRGTDSTLTGWREDFMLTFTRSNAQEEARRYLNRILKEEKRGVLSLHGEDGYPYGIPMDHWYCEEDGKIYFHGAKAGHKIDALAKDNRVSYCVYDAGFRREGEWALNITSVVVFGRISLVTDEAKAARICEQICRKFTDDEAYIQKELTNAVPRVQCLELVIDHMTGKLVNES